MRLALRLDASAVCEKPLVLNPWNLDLLQDLEAESAGKIYTVLQLRLHPSLIVLRERIRAERKQKRFSVRLTYVTGRGKWYHYSWKGNEERSGGIVTNIGIHFFDLLMWLFGSVRNQEVYVNTNERAGGFIELEHADVEWFLSINLNDVPENGGLKPRTFRSILIDGAETEFSSGFTDLHTRVYEDILAGGGFGIEDSRPSIELVHAIRNGKVKNVTSGNGEIHPLIKELSGL